MLRDVAALPAAIAVIGFFGVRGPPMLDETSHSIPLSEVPEGKMHACAVNGREIVICRTKGGIYALDNICTHAYARLSEGRLRGNRLICPLHGASFDVRDGRVLGAPATRPLAAHALRVSENRIEVAVPPPDSKPIAL
jgi:nitrite reductase/ring-hydroxylating ferredoxin subunit